MGGEQLEARYLLTTFVVDTIEDEIITRLTCPDGKVSLREAILAANHDSQLDRSFGCSSPGSDVPAGSGADTITFSPALAGETITLLDIITISDDLTITGLGVGNLSIEGPADQVENFTFSSEAFKVDDEDPDTKINVQISDLTFSGVGGVEALTIRDVEVVNGGGISGSTLHVSNSVIDGNVRGIGAQAGTITDTIVRNNIYGGIFANGDDLTITNSVIQDNSGGGLFLTGDRVSIDNVVVSNNQGGILGFSGSGGIIAYNIADLSITNSVITGNSRGIHANGNVTNVKLSNSIVADNDDGIRNMRGATVAIDHTTISGNGSQGNGGVLNLPDSYLTLVSSTVVDNTGGFSDGGGGIYNNGTATIINSTISNNVSKKGGGGIYNVPRAEMGNGTVVDAGVLTITGSTITENYAPGGGGGLRGASAVLISTIVAGNHAGIETIVPDDLAAYGFDATPPSPSFNNLIGIQLGTSSEDLLVDGVNGNQVGVVDPFLGPLEDNGGPTMTHALLRGSPAIDAGLNPLGLAMDQRGEPRTLGQATDIGAFESPLPQLPPSELLVKSLRGQGDSVVLTYELTEAVSDPVVFGFVRSDDDLLSMDDQLYPTLTVTPADLSNALAAGEHQYTFSPDQVPHLLPLINDPEIASIYVIGGEVIQPTVETSFKPYRGAYQAAPTERAILRTGPLSTSLTVAPTQISGELELNFQFDTATGTEDFNATVTSPADIVIIASDSDDFIRVDPNLTVDTIIDAGNGLNLVVGGAGNDEITGGDDIDVLLGEGFELEVATLKDFLDNLAMGRINLATLSLEPVGMGNDILRGGDGFDVLIGGPGTDELRSGAGGGLLMGDGFRVEAALDYDLSLLLNAPDLDAAKQAFFKAFGFSAEIALAGNGDDMIYGGSGIDVVFGGDGNDTFEALDPEDNASSGGIVDVIFGNDGDDTINDRAANFTLAVGGAGDDVLIGGMSASFLIGGDDNDTLAGGPGVDVLLGDTLDFAASSNIAKVLSGFGDGNLSFDVQIGPGDPEIAGNDVLSGGPGFDFLVGGYGDDYLEGGDGAGLLFGDTFNFSASLGINFAESKDSQGQDDATTHGKSGNLLSKALSLFSANVGFDLVGQGADTIVGSLGLDVAFGGDGPDKIYSGGGAVDLLFGNEGDDELRGGGDFTQLLAAVAGAAPNAMTIRDFGTRIRNGESLRMTGLDDSSFSIMVGGIGNDKLFATPAEDGVPGTIAGSVLIGDDFDFKGLPTTPADVFKIEFNGLLPTKFAVEAGFVQEGDGNDELEGAAGGFNLLIGGDGDDQVTGQGFFDILMGDSFNLGIDVGVTLDYSNLSLDKSEDENLDAIDTSFKLPGLAGSGADMIHGGDGFTLAIGGDGADTIRDDGGKINLLFGNDGNDSIFAQDGFNLIGGGFGDDNLVGGSGSNIILGDRYSFATLGSLALAAIEKGDLRTGIGFVSSGNGRDTIVGGPGFDFIIAGDGRDTVDAGDGTNVVLGDAIDLLIGNVDFAASFWKSVKSLVFGGRNGLLQSITDALGFTGDGDDILTGGSNTDIIFGGGGDDVISGGGNGLDEFDFLVGGVGNDVVKGEAGDDVVMGGPGDDELRGGTGNDVLESEGGVDRFYGEEGNDQIFGGAENDFLYGGPGNDELHGEEGDDLLDGGTGNNVFIDDQGNNTIVTSPAPIVGFQPIADGVGGLPAGTLQEFDGFGNSMAGIGDVDGNGVPDVAVGTFDAVYILLLNADGTVLNHVKIADGEGGLPDEVLNERVDSFGGQVRDAFGQAVTGLGDLNHDGTPDIAVGAPALSEDEIAGSVHILFLNPDGTVGDHAQITDGMSGLPDGTIGTDYRFGTSLTTLPDINGDGVDDLAVGTQPNGTNQHVFVLLMNDDGTVKASTRIADGVGGLPAGSLTAIDSFGVAIASLGDMDGDGISDLAVGAPGDANAGGIYAGAVYIFSLNADGTVKSTTKISDGVNGLPSGTTQKFDGLGSALAALGDRDGDGVTELAVAAHKGLDGTVYILYLAADGTVKSNFELYNGSGETPDGLWSPRFGMSLTATGDINGDGANDIAIAGGGASFVTDRINIVFLQPQTGHDVTVNLQDGAGTVEIVNDANDLVLKLPGGSELTRLQQNSLQSLQIVGSATDDVLAVSNSFGTVGPPIRFRAGDGNDRLDISIEDVTTAFPLFDIDLGEGVDTLGLTGSNQDLDLSVLGDANLQGIEKFDIVGSGGNLLTLRVDDVVNISSTTGTLRIHHNEDDLVNYGSGWKVEIPRIIDSEYVHILTQGTATIEVANTSPNQNPLRSLDANRDGSVSPLDALVVINRLNTDGSGPLSTPSTVIGLTEFFYFDVNGDDFVAPLDVLQVINFLNASASSPEGEFTFPHIAHGIPNPAVSSPVLSALKNDQNAPTFPASATITIIPSSPGEHLQFMPLDRITPHRRGPIAQDLVAAIDAFFEDFEFLTP